MPRERITIKRVYDPPSSNDGTRILVDRLWPRGLSKESASVDHWLKAIAPTTDLRKWFHADPDARYEAFTERYIKELRTNPEPFEDLRRLTQRGRATLLYGSKDTAQNHALILQGLLKDGL